MTIEHAASRRSWPYALLALMCAVAVTGTLLGGTRPLAAAPFATTGHWVYNSVLRAVFHVDGGTANVDAQLPLESEVGSQVLQGDTEGFVVGPGRITAFDKATLSPKGSRAAPAGERPLGIEVLGGPYAVYRDAGKVVRLGDPAATISTGGPIGRPVVTDDGTMWLHRTGSGSICTLARDAVELSGCPVSAPADHPGALTVIGRRPAFVDLFTGELHTVDNGAFGPGRPLGARFSPDSRPATRDAAGLLAIFDPARRSLLLADVDGPPADPVAVALPPGDYDGPVSTGEVVVLVDREHGAVLTFGPDGARRDEKPVRPGSGEPRLAEGEDGQVYVEDSRGTQVLVVAHDGEVRDVDVTGDRPGTSRPDEPDPPARHADQDVALPGQQPTGRPDPGTTAPQQPQRTTQPPPAAVPPGRPGAPPSVIAQAGDGSAVVTWGAAPDNRSPITSYLVSWRGSGGGTGSLTVGGDVGQVTAGGLTNGESYVVTVAAANAVGAGPGTSSNPVTPVAPVAPADPPADLAASVDPDARPTRDVTLTWSQPALNGGALEHYVVGGTGLPSRETTAPRATYPQLRADTAYTFTVYAVTRTPDGRLLDGAAASTTVAETPAPPVSARIAQGGPSETGNCKRPACAWVNATMSGLDPNTRYALRLSSNSNGNVRTEEFTSDAGGNAAYNELNYDVPGQTVWVTVLTGDRRREIIRSNSITWE